MNDNIQTVQLNGRDITLVGTAHVSRESVDEVAEIIRQTQPDRVCVEIDDGRFRSMTEQSSWAKLDVVKVLKEGRGFLLLANLALSSFQRRLGQGLGVKPGDEMKRAVEVATELGIPASFCDREVTITLKRAWASCGFFSKIKLMTALVSSAFTNEKLEAAEIEALKNKNELDGMMGELADYLPSIKRTLIDERDEYLAARIWSAEGSKLVAVLGAGHLGGVAKRLGELASGQASADTSSLDTVPPPSVWGKVAGWLLPILIVGLLGLGFLRSGAAVSLGMLIRWMLLNGSLAALGALVAGGHILSIIVSFLGAPIATINPFIGVGLFSGVVEATVRRPRVSDVEQIADDIASVKGVYRNRITRALLVFFLSSIGGAIGNFISIPYLTSLIVK